MHCRARGGDDLRLMEVDEVANHIKGLVDPEADIIWGSAFDPALEGRIRVSVFATGIDMDAKAAPEPARIAPVTAAAASTARIAALRPTEGFAPVQLDLRIDPPQAGARDAATEDELLLVAERRLVLVPPEGAGELPTIDPFTAEPAADATSPPVRGPSLFERIAMAARGAREAEAGGAVPGWTEQRIARRA
jgi:cell division protein FtsZ